MICYKRFFKTLKRKGISQYDLEYHYHISKGTMDKLRNNKNITLLTLECLCQCINCEPYEIFEFIKEEKQL